jgi:hypothetical protein
LLGLIPEVGGHLDSARMDRINLGLAGPRPSCRAVGCRPSTRATVAASGEVSHLAPLANAQAMRETLQSLGYRSAFIDSQAEDWLASRCIREQGPVLIRAGRAAGDWMNRPGTEQLSADGVFLAACL